MKSLLILGFTAETNRLLFAGNQTPFTSEHRTIVCSAQSKSPDTNGVLFRKADFWGEDSFLFVWAAPHLNQNQDKSKVSGEAAQASILLLLNNKYQ
jgi:hypothetical protein